MNTAIRKLVNTYNPQTVLWKASTPPSSWYTDPRIFEVEQRTIFHRSWQLAGRSDQVRDPGQYITWEIAGEPILVIRGSDSVLRGFFNVCRHHAAAVMTKCDGKAENLRCPYHGWTYDLEGKLILHDRTLLASKNSTGAPTASCPFRLPNGRAGYSLNSTATARAWMNYVGADLIERLEPLNLERLNWFERRSYFLNCNWKVFVDNYLDGGYHVPHIHGGLSSVLDNSQIPDRNRRTLLPAIESHRVGKRRSAEPAAVAQRRARQLFLDLSQFHDQHLRRSDGHQSGHPARRR